MEDSGEGRRRLLPNHGGAAMRKTNGRMKCAVRPSRSGTGLNATSVANGRAIPERKDETSDLLDVDSAGQADAESAESTTFWYCGLLEDPIDERDYRAAEEAQYYSDLASIVRRLGSAENQECSSDDLEDINGR